MKNILDDLKESEKEDELLEVLDSVFEENGAIPQKVSNRLLLAAIRRTYRIGQQNTINIRANRVAIIVISITMMFFISAFVATHPNLLTLLEAVPLP